MTPSESPDPLPVTYDDVAAAAARLAGHAHRTPVMTSRFVDAATGARVFFKCENFQRIGAFKFRGAFNALSRLDPGAKARGVVAYSSGNHAQAVAAAGAMLGVPTVIVMPQDAPAVKVAATRGYGAEVVLYDRATMSREALAAQIAGGRGLTVIPPFDHPDVVAGQGTAAKELVEDAGPLDYLFVCVGGGGLISGCAIAATHLSPGCKVIGVEPAAGDDATRSFKTRTLQTCENPDTIADGARTHSLGRITFPLVLAHVHDMTTVDDATLLKWMVYLWERLKIVVEPTGALGAAGLLEGKADVRGARVGVIVSGGNVDLAAVCRALGRC
jgi:threo-3-hydroxy-L-aspartate ammonia-lyase